jgi:rhodanese-related sulfurtransferase/DNA-binding transcriptional ArsR family regulator
MLTSPHFRDTLLSHFARIGKAVSSPSRLKLLDLLAQGEKNVETLARQAGLTVKNTSAHLRALRAVSLVADRRDGTHIYYALADEGDEGVVAFLRSLEELACRHLAEVERIVQQHFESLDELEPLGAAELTERMRTDELVLLDVRPPDEYRAGHIPGAISIPVGELERRLAEIPPDREVVAYCRGPYCVLSLQAITVLRERGRSVRRLAVGLPDWRALGYPIEADEAAEVES